MPASWADLILNQWEGFDPPLPRRRMSRAELWTYCQARKTPPMHAFIAIMAWGGQRPRSDEYRKDIERKQKEICKLMTELRRGMPREEAYNSLKGKVWGLGPSFITKILAFMCPNGDMAIMDQWAVKAVNLRYKPEVIRLVRTKPGVPGTSPCRSNTGRDYDRYCRHLEDLQHRLGEASLSATEERIFSRRGEAWRAYVEKNWKQLELKKRPSMQA